MEGQRGKQKIVCFLDRLGNVMIINEIPLELIFVCITPHSCFFCPHHLKCPELML